MISAVLALVVYQPEMPDRLRTILPNGAIVLVEKTAQEPVALDLWVRSGTGPTGDPRHLLEHLIARGARGDVDEKLEGVGGFLTASTYRDAMRFHVEVPASAVDVGLAALREMSNFPRLLREEILRETATIRQEAAGRSESERSIAQAWTKLYGSQAFDPFGDPAAMAAETSESLRNLHHRMFTGGNLVVAARGPIDVQRVTERLRALLSPFLPGASPPPLRDSLTGGVWLRGERGWIAMLAVKDFRDPMTAATLAAALALASETADAYLAFTPSGGPGAIGVGSESGVDPRWRGLASESLYNRGRSLANRWIDDRLSTNSGAVSLRGLLLVQGLGLRPEILRENLRLVTSDQFATAFHRFQELAP